MKWTGNTVRIPVEIRNRGNLVRASPQGPLKSQTPEPCGKSRKPRTAIPPGTRTGKPLEILSSVGTLMHSWRPTLVLCHWSHSASSHALCLLISFLLLLYQVCGWFCYISQLTKAQLFKPGPCRGRWPLLLREQLRKLIQSWRHCSFTGGDRPPCVWSA